MATLVRISANLPGTIIGDGISEEMVIPVDQLRVNTSPPRALKEILPGKIVSSSVSLGSGIVVTGHTLTTNFLTVQFEPFDVGTSIALTVDCDPAQ